MRRKITCYCDNSFEVDVPDEINLDTEPSYFDQILNGSFLNYECPSCGKKHKPEFPITIQWPSKKLCFEVFPELERGEFYRRKKAPSQKEPLETIIGYPEMAERLAMIRDNFEPAPIEAIKYYLHLKAEEQYPEQELDIWYFGFTGTQSEPLSLEFHIHGIRENEVAIMKVPSSLYQKTLDDYRKHPKNEIFSALRVKTYLSVKNTMRPEALL